MSTPTENHNSILRVSVPVTLAFTHTRFPAPTHYDNNNLQASISGKMSSQFLSSLLMASPVVDGDVTISIKDELISAPYVALTIGLMKKFGVEVAIDGDMEGTPSFTITESQTYQSPETILVEGDASLASYFLAGATIFWWYCHCPRLRFCLRPGRCRVRQRYGTNGSHRHLGS